MLDRDELHANAAKEVMRPLRVKDQTPEEIVNLRGFRQVFDTVTLKGIVDQVLFAHPSEVEELREEKTRVLGFLMGQAMKSSDGKTHPTLLKELFAKKFA